MAKPYELPQVPAAVKSKLWAVRQRSLRLCAAQGLAVTAAILLAAMMGAMLIDWWVVLFDWRWRAALAAVALVAPAAALAYWAVRLLFGRPGLVNVAMQVDRAAPVLAERWSTVIELNQTADPPEIRGAAALIEKVSQEAAELSHAVVPREVLSGRSVRRWALIFAGLLAVLGLALLMGFDQTSALMRRFWAPTGNIAMTRVTALTGSRAVAKGQSLTLDIKQAGRLRNTATLLFRQNDGSERQMLMTASDGDREIFNFTVASVQESFEYRARCGDGQTAWHRIEAVERPRIAQVRFLITPPEYSKLPRDRRDSLPRRCRALEGSRMKVEFLPSKPLARMELHFPENRKQVLLATKEQWYGFEMVLNDTIAFSPVAVDRHGLTNLDPPQCRIRVYRDMPPVVEIVSPFEDIVAPPDDNILIEIRVSDDYGVRDAELLVTAARGDQNEQSKVIPIVLDKNAGGKNARGKVNLDLKPFALKHGQELTYEVRATDIRSTRASRAGTIRTGQNKTAEHRGAATDDEGSQDRSDRPADQSTDGQAGSAPDTEVAQGLSEKDSKGDPSSRPADDMIRRHMPGAGTACSQEQRIQVDEWVGKYEGQIRKKLRIAIDHYIQRLDASLAAAEQGVGGLCAHLEAKKPWAKAEDRKTAAARDHLTSALETIVELKAVSTDTPYAFMGLQLADIGLSHVNPAANHLKNASAVAIGLEQRSYEFGQGLLHIRRARRLLADLTKRYEAIKRNEKLHETMERVSKMHQLFVEDMQALMGSSKPKLNPRTGQMTEVEISDEFLAKVRERLEEIKKVLDELAKVLAEDPELLRRFMAMTRKSKYTVRDQLTLLAVRQERLRSQADQWLKAKAQNALPGMQAKLALEQVNEQKRLAEDAAQLSDNMVTWLPRDIGAAAAPIDECRKLAADAALQAARVSSDMASGKTDLALQHAAALIESVRKLDLRLAEYGGVDHDNPRLDIYIAKRDAEVERLLSGQTGWVRKVKALRQGRYEPAAVVDQHRLKSDTHDFAVKLESWEAMLARMSDKIAEKIRHLMDIVAVKVVAEQAAAVEALCGDRLAEARQAQGRAVRRFAEAEKIFDELLTLVEEQIPPPAEAGMPRLLSLERLLAMLENELEACEKLGLACNRINVMFISDWSKLASGEGSGAGSGSGQSPAQQAKEAQAYAEMAADEMEKAMQAAAAERAGLAQNTETHGQAQGRSDARGADRGQRWDTLVSKLRKELTQQRGTVPPERYRRAIDAYFRRISEKMSETPVSP